MLQGWNLWGLDSGPSMLLPMPLLQGAEVVSALHLEAAESGSPEILDG